MTQLDLPLTASTVNSGINTHWAAVITYGNALLTLNTTAQGVSAANPVPRGAWRAVELMAELDSLLAQLQRNGF